MLRIRFTARDLALTRLAPTADPMWELSLSMHQLRLPGANPFLEGWKQSTARRLQPYTPLRGEVALGLTLSPPRGYFPDFLTPYDGVHGFEAGIDAVTGTDPQRLNEEISQLTVTDRALAPVVDDLRRGTAPAMHALESSLRAYHETAIAPVWDRVTGAVEADRARRMKDLADGGWAKLLDNLHPEARFRDDTFEIDKWGMNVEAELDLDGRGLLIIPSYFKEERQLMVLADTALPPVLLYPIDPSARLSSHGDHSHLPALIGQTRSRVLECAVTGGSTSAIATRAGISLPAASKHLDVLHRAGLVHRNRTQNTVHHLVTGLGLGLLNGATALSPGSDAPTSAPPATEPR
ncbi:transcriptional regulator [Catellatospora sp. NPDC049609]|uniref:ArsR/SmtB family transcription factor n=1 Tax=Catellatospora sp. NPDC049609 TaxID=3155505 RepID=UPI00343850E5